MAKNVEVGEVFFWKMLDITSDDYMGAPGDRGCKNVSVVYVWNSG